MEKIKKELVNFKTIAIYGAMGTGKTSLAYTLIDELKKYKKTVYFFNHPRPEMIEALGYENIDSLERLEDIQDCVLYLDEPQITLPLYNKKANRIISQICSLSRQLDITLIISTSDTRVFTKANEAFFDTWIVKDLDYDMVKNGSKIKKIMQKNAKFDAAGLRLKNNEFLFETRNHSRLNGLHAFTEVSCFNKKHSTPYRPETANKIETANKVPTRIETANEKNTEISATLQIQNREKLLKNEN